MFTAFLPNQRTPLVCCRRPYRITRSDFCSGYWYRQPTAADGLAVGRASGFVGRAMGVCWMASIPLAIKPCMTCLAAGAGRRYSSWTFGTGGYGRTQRVCASVSYQQMHGFSAEQRVMPLIWCGRREVEWCRKKRGAISGKRPLINFQCSIAILSWVSDAADGAGLRFYRLTCYTLSFYHHPTPFAVNGGFANQPIP